MKIKHLFLFVAMAAAMVVSCGEKEEPIVPEITIATANIPAISDEGGSFTVSFTSSLDWTVTKDANWISVNPTSGSAGQATITITAQPNSTYDERTGSVTIACASENERKTEQISVVQKQKGALILTPNTFNAGCEGETISVTVKHNSEVSVSIADDAKDWIIPIDTKGIVEDVLQFEIKPNEDYDPRSGVITFSNEAGSEKVTVNQKEKGALLIPEPNFSVSHEGATISVTVQANAEVTATVADAAKDWITPVTTKGLVDNVFSFDVLPNETYDERIGKITFSSAAGSAEVTVTQEAAPPAPPADENIYIYNAAGLVQFAEDYNKREYSDKEDLCVVLAADINFDETTSAAFNATGGIGNKDGEDTNYFHGLFDGASHTIDGLAATVPLFAYIGSEGVVKDFTVGSQCSFVFTHPGEADAYFGAVAGYHKGTVVNVIVNADVTLAGTNGSVEVNTMLGGLVGRATTGQVISSAYAGNITAPADFGAYNAKLIIGGLVGYFSNAGSVSGSTFAGTISNSAKVSSSGTGSKDPYTVVGGIVGYNAAGTISDCETLDNPKIEGAYAGTTGTIVCKSDLAYSTAIGGIVGENLAAVSGCVNKAQITTTIFKFDNQDSCGRYLRIGGIAGRNTDEGSIVNCNNEGAVNTRSNPRLHSVGGIVGWNGAQTAVSGCTNSAALNISTTGTGSYSARLPYFGGVIGENYSSNISDIHNTGEVLLSRTENNTGTTVRMGGVIGSNHAPIDGGQNRSITNSGKVYFNCNISNQAAEYGVGGIVGYTESSVKGALNRGYVLFNWNSDANVASKAHVGGIVGTLISKDETLTYEISNCQNEPAEGVENSGEVNIALKKGAAAHTGNFAGGILGYTDAPVSMDHCENLGYIHGGNTNKMNGTTFYVGGIVAYIKGASSISNCSSMGQLLNDHFNNTTTKTGACFEGGIAGFAEGTSEARLTITNVVDAGVGNGPRRGYRGGVAGYAEFVDISNAKCYGDFVSGSAYYIGGVVGWAVNTTIKDALYDGKSIQTTQLKGAGGIVAILDAASEIDGCSSKVTTIDMMGTAVTAVGAIAGMSVEGSTIANSHYVNGSLSICSDSNFTDGGGNAADITD
jgi:hypothetical protein